MSALDMVKAAVLCEEVRLEANGKHVLIGATGNGLAIAQLPGRIAIALYIELEIIEFGDHEFELRVTAPNGDELTMALEVNRRAAALDDIVTIMTPRFDVNVTEEGKFTVDFRKQGDEWANLMTRPLVLIENATVE